MDALQKLISRNLRNVCMPERMMVRHLLSRAVIYKPYGFSCSCQASDHYIRLPHLCLCQTDIWKGFEMVRSGSVRKMHSDDGRMIKFITSFGSVTETCF